MESSSFYYFLLSRVLLIKYIKIFLYLFTIEVVFIEFIY